MRTFKQYAGVILMLLTVALLAGSFYGNLLMDAELNHIILGVSFLLVIVSVILIILGGKSADKIGGK